MYKQNILLLTRMHTVLLCNNNISYYRKLIVWHNKKIKGKIFGVWLQLSGSGTQ